MNAGPCTTPQSSLDALLRSMSSTVLPSKSLRFSSGAKNLFPPAPLENLLVAAWENLKRPSNLAGVIKSY